MMFNKRTKEMDQLHDVNADFLISVTGVLLGVLVTYRFLICIEYLLQTEQ